MNTLIPVLAVTVGPVLALAPVVWALRPQGGRHTGLRVKAVAGWSPYDLRTREAFRYYAAKRREPGLHVPGYATAARDLTGAFPVVRAA